MRDSHLPAGQPPARVRKPPEGAHVTAGVPPHDGQRDSRGGGLVPARCQRAGGQRGRADGRAGNRAGYRAGGQRQGASREDRPVRHRLAVRPGSSRQRPAGVRRQRTGDGDAAAHGRPRCPGRTGTRPLGRRHGSTASTSPRPWTPRGLRVFLDFAAAMTHSTVTLNGTQVADHLGGYLPFRAEITGHLRPDGNVLAVTLDSTFNLDVPPDRPAAYISTSVDFWQPGGIYRDVSLRAVPQIFLADVFAKPVNVMDASTRQVVVQVTVDAAVVPSGTVAAHRGPGGRTRTLSSATVPVTISQVGRVTVTATLTGLPDITLWDTDRPRLYTVVATLVADGSRLHDYQVRTGFREAVFQSDGFYLNGYRVKLFGLNRHQFFPYAGGAMPARIQAKDAEILRNELNCNMVRCSHYPQSEDFYDACDELGLLVWEEIPGWGYFGDAAWQQAAYQDLHDMIVRDRSRPSVIVWGAMPNEAGEQVAEYTLYNELAHSLDDSRPTGGDGSTTNASFVFDVYSNHDYSSVTGPGGVREPTLDPPVDAAGKPYLICEAIGTLVRARHLLPAHRHPGRPAGRGDGARDRAEHRGVRRPLLRPARLGRVRLPVRQRQRVPGGQVRRSTRPVPDSQARCRHLPGASRPEAQAGHRARLLLGLRLHVAGDQPGPRDDLRQPRPAPGVCRRPVVRDRHAGHQRLRAPPRIRRRSWISARWTARPGRNCASTATWAANKVASRSFAADPSGDRLSLAADDTEIDGDGADATRLAFRAVDTFGAPRPYVDRAGHADRRRPRGTRRRQPGRLHRHGGRGRGLDPVVARLAGHGDGQGQPSRAR